MLVPIYFGNVQLSPINGMESEYRAVLPSWSLLCIEFIKPSVLELVIEEQHKKQITAIICTLGYKPLLISSPLENFLRGPRAQQGSDNGRVNAQIFLRMAHKMITRHNSAEFKRFYASMTEEALRKLGILPLIKEERGARTQIPVRMEVVKEK